MKVKYYECEKCGAIFRSKKKLSEHVCRIRIENDKT